MSQIHHAQAVEAAKCPNCKYPLDVPWEGDGKTFVALSAPGPSRDAEWCREFVRKCREQTCVSFYRDVFDYSEEELAADLTAAIGGRGDDGEAVTEEWLRSIGFTKGRFPDDLVLNPVVRGVIRNAQSPMNGKWHWCVRSYPIPYGKEPTTRREVRRLLAALGIPTEPAK